MDGMLPENKNDQANEILAKHKFDLQSAHLPEVWIKADSGQFCQTGRKQDSVKSIGRRRRRDVIPHDADQLVPGIRADVDIGSLPVNG
jgi:hypothetical protein